MGQNLSVQVNLQNMTRFSIGMGFATFLWAILEIIKMGMKSDIRRIKKSKVYSVKEFQLLPEKDQNGSKIIVGVLYNDNYHYSFLNSTLHIYDWSSLMSIFNRKKYYLTVKPNFFTQTFNLRSQYVNKTSTVFGLFNDLLANFSNNHIDISETEHYLLHGDQVGVYLEADRKKGYISLPFLFQGNKYVLLKSMRSTLSSISHFQFFTSLPLLYYLGFKLIFYLRSCFSLTKNETIPSAVSLPNSRENCQRCHSNIANIIMKECNHFFLCALCFEGLNRTCPLCNYKCKHFIILTL
jgi:hypothetical protein